MAARPERGPDGHDSCLLGHVALAHQHFWLTPEEWEEKQPLLSGHCTLSSDARLDNREQLIQLLHLDQEQAVGLSDASLIMHSYYQWGVDCLHYLLGDYIFALWDDRKQHVFLARDALGARDICYYVDKIRCLAASEVSQILSHPAVEARINDNRVAARLGHLWDKPEETYYENIKYLPPAHGMIVTAERVKLWRYWDVDAHKTIHCRDDREYADQYLVLLTDAVRCRLRTVGPVGISLSGGLDSSALAAIAVPLVPKLVFGQERFVSFSYLFDELRSFDRARSGHLYFTLKDEHAQLKFVMSRTHAQRLSFQPQAGDALLVHGRISIYESGGVYIRRFPGACGLGGSLVIPCRYVLTFGIREVEVIGSILAGEAAADHHGFWH